MDSNPVLKRKDSKSGKDLKPERKNSKELKNSDKEEKKQEKVQKTDKEEDKKAKKQKKLIKKQLQDDIKTINENIMKDGENTFYTILPQKIKKLDEFLKTNTLFQKNIEDVYTAVCVDQSIIAIQAEEAADKLKKYVKECVSNYDCWRKTQINEKESVTTGIELQAKRRRTGSEDISKSLPLPPAIVEEKEDEDSKKETEVPKFPTEAVIDINHSVNEVIEYVKSELRDGFRMLASIKMWIQLQVPKIEDGNNFGVEIQSEVIDAISGVEEMCLNILDNMSHYFETRATFVQKIVRYPNIRDFYQSLKEVDQTEFINMKLSCSDLRNNYCALFDLILKNIDKLLTPRTNNDIANTMY